MANFLPEMYVQLSHKLHCTVVTIRNTYFMALIVNTQPNHHSLLMFLFIYVIITKRECLVSSGVNQQETISLYGSMHSGFILNVAVG